MVKCALCGNVFDEEKEDSVCSGCPISKGCKLIRCPSCGYEFPPEGKWLKNLFKKRRKQNELDR